MGKLILQIFEARITRLKSNVQQCLPATIIEPKTGAISAYSLTDK